MARITNLHTRLSHNNLKEIETEEIVEFIEIGYGLYEDIYKKDCYGVEEVYETLDDWN